MTCDEHKSLIASKSPFEATTAERVASSRHLQECETCRARMFGGRDQAAVLLSFAICEPEIFASAVQQAHKDVADGEARIP